MAVLEPETVEELSPEATLALEPALVALLKDVVDDGASVGFLPPLAAYLTSGH